jgi:hypothetical protein
VVVVVDVVDVVLDPVPRRTVSFERVLSSPVAS